MTPNADQQLVIDEFNKGKNLLISGKAGTGKSALLQMLIESTSKTYIAVAPTGIAASNIPTGLTIHSFFGMNVGGVMTPKTCRIFAETNSGVNPYVAERLRCLEVIFVDEAFMVRPDILDSIIATLVLNKCDLTKIQFVFLGDDKQLKPILTKLESSEYYTYYKGLTIDNAKSFGVLPFTNCNLDIVERQSDVEFIEALNQVRVNPGVLPEYFNQFKTTTIPKDSVLLTPFKQRALDYNTEMYNKTKTIIPELISTAEIKGSAKLTDCNLPSVVKLKDGCRYMCLVNNALPDCYNGTLGTIRKYHAGWYFITDTCKTPIPVNRYTKNIYEINNGKTTKKLIGSISQFPFELANAFTIHKSQGLTVDKACVDFTTPYFEPAQLYVALSRLRSPKGLSILVSE